MKIRDGFVSNSSSGSFIFPEGMTVDDVWRVLEKTEVFLTDLEGKDVSCGLENIRVFDSTYEGRYWNFEDQLWISHRDPKKYYGRVIADTEEDNSCPWTFHEILTNVIKAEYFHHGG
jgi:hypothetical protein